VFGFDKASAGDRFVVLASTVWCLGNRSGEHRDNTRCATIDYRFHIEPDVTGKIEARSRASETARQKSLGNRAGSSE